MTTHSAQLVLQSFHGKTNHTSEIPISADSPNVKAAVSLHLWVIHHTLANMMSAGIHMLQLKNGPAHHAPPMC